MNSDLVGAKVGDTIYIKGRFGGVGHIEKIARVTPTGRVVTYRGTQYEPNGRERGTRGFQATWARIATDDDIKGVNRAHVISTIERFREWSGLNADDLKTVSEIIAKYKQPSQP
jgi:hypothetical protein